MVDFVQVMELLGTPALQKEVYPRLIRYTSFDSGIYFLPPTHKPCSSRDPQIAFTAGQWMTEASASYATEPMSY